jgi:hypothetical protein
MKRIKNGSYDDIQACKAYENLLTSQKKYIVESLNKGHLFVEEFGLLTTRKLNKDIRRQISCLLVNNFLEHNEHEIKQLTDEGEPAQQPEPEPQPEPEQQPQPEQEENDICEYCEKFMFECECNICHHCDERMGACECKVKTKAQQEKEEKEIIINKLSSWCGRCENSMIECICYSPLVSKLDHKIEYLEESLKGAQEIINSHKPIEAEANKEINKLKKQNKELKLKSQSDYEALKNMGCHIDNLNVENQKLNVEYQNLKCESSIWKKFYNKYSEDVETVEKLKEAYENLQKDYINTRNGMRDLLEKF